MRLEFNAFIKRDFIFIFKMHLNIIDMTHKCEQKLLHFNKSFNKLCI
jgi:hypothetical protein